MERRFIVVINQFLHAHYFQSTVHQYISDVGKLIGALCIISSLAYAACHVMLQT